MSENFVSTVIPLGNVGLATDKAHWVRQLTHYETCENVVFEISGAVRKIGGNERINSTAITSTPSITGMFDFWRAGGAAAFTQKFVVFTSNSKVYKEDMDGTFDDITGGATITANAIPVFCQAYDLLLIFDDKNDTPLKWNQSGNVASLGGTPPVGRGAAFHVNRAWAWGVNANPSRLYYSSSTDTEDWSGADTGSIDIDPEDGDRIIGAISHKRRLVVFKGPNKGSIHIISGTAPTGGDAFSRTLLARGIALQTHNSIIEVGDDVWFMSDQGCHSLSATEQFGDFRATFLTRFLHGFFKNNINRARFNQVWGANYAFKDCALWTYPNTGSSNNDRVLGLSYERIQEDGLKPFVWTRGGASMTIRIHPTTKEREVVTGSTDGFALREDTGTRRLADDSAYSMRLTTPDITLGEIQASGRPKAYAPIALQRIGLRSAAAGSYDVTVVLARDSGAGTTHKFDQGTSGFLLGTSVLDVDSLGGANILTAFDDLSGEARTVTLDITQGGLDEDAHLYEAMVDWKPSGYSTQTDLSN